MKAARAKLLSDSIQAAAQNPRTLWQAANRLLHSVAPAQSVPGDMAVKRASELATYFSQKVQTIKLTIANMLAASPVCPATSHARPVPFAEFCAVSPSEVAVLLASLRVNKSSEVDVISVQVLRSCSPLFARILSVLFNLFL